MGAQQLAAPRMRTPGSLPSLDLEVHEAPEVTVTARRLLVAYADSLDLVERLPAAPMVSTGWRWWLRPNRPIRLPRATWMLKPMLVWHIDRVLTGAARVFHRRVAIGIAGPAEADALDAIERFRSSLPPRSKLLRLGVFALATILLAQILGMLLPQHVATGVPLGRQTGQLFNATFGAFEPTAHSIASAAGGLTKASPAALAAGLLACSPCLPI
jgi:hypothetical protein